LAGRSKGQKKEPAKKNREETHEFKIRLVRRRLLPEVRIGQSARFTVDRELLREWLAKRIRDRMQSWPQEDARVTSDHISEKALYFFEERLRRALAVALNALASGATLKAIDDWKGQIVTVSPEASVRVPPLDDLKSKGRANTLEYIENAWRSILDFRGKGGVYPDASKESRYREVARFWTAEYEKLVRDGVDDRDARKYANRKAMQRFKIRYSTLAAWRKAGKKLS